MNHTLGRKYDRIFFSGTAIFFLLMNIIGFGSSLNSRLETEGSLSMHIYIHGICAALWIILYFIQTTFIATSNRLLHIKFGKIGFFILLLVLLTGFYVAFMVPVIYNVDPPYSQPGRDFSAILLSVGVAFAGILYRKKPFAHKRLMMMATLLLSSAGIARAVSFLGLSLGGPTGVILTLFLPLIALIIYDLSVYRRLSKLHLISFLAICCLFILAAPAVWTNNLLQPVIESVVSWLS